MSKLSATLLQRVDWVAATIAFDTLHQQTAESAQLRRRANALSLAALFTPDARAAMQSLARAIEAEPLNPLHLYRLALAQMRFGQWQAALETLDLLIENLPKNLVLPQYLRGLCYLKTDLEKRANNIAQEIEIAAPGHAAAKFLAADAGVRQRFKSVAKSFSQLPKNAQHEGLWADLMLKTLLLHPEEGAQFLEKFLTEQKHLPAGSHAVQLLRHAIAWQKSTDDEFVELLQKTPPGSKTEEVALLCFYNGALRKSAGAGPGRVLVHINRLYETLPERQSVRRLLIAATTRTIAREAGQSNFVKALSLNELCLRLEPFNPIHHQNRATIFTLMREREAYHEAWENLDRLEYRLLLFGLTDERMLRSVARRHRMFAQQARLTVRRSDGSPTVHQGIFKEDQIMRQGEQVWQLDVNKSILDEDPEQLRQWIWHRQAELVFSHLALGPAPGRFLLGFPDENQSKKKLGALLRMTDALAVLAGDEGERLRDTVRAFWQARFAETPPDYAPPLEAPDKDILFLQESYLDTIGDLCMLCQSWTPNPRQEQAMRELLAFLQALTPFLDIELLFRQQRDQVPVGWLWLRHSIMERFDLKKQPGQFYFKQQQQLTHELSASLLVNFSWEKFNEDRSPGGIVRAIQLLDEARTLAPAKPEVEYFAAMCFYHGHFFNDANAAIRRFYKIVKDKESNLVKRIEEIQEAIRKADPAQNRPFLRASDSEHTPGDAPEQVPVFFAPDLQTEESLRQDIGEMPSNLKTTKNWPIKCSWPLVGRRPSKSPNRP
ncbi:MAG: hypothetical protein IPM81_02060 [Saprospirales bacterium]|nr:hypothetical protein [Saprospirales bacterium]